MKNLRKVLGISMAMVSGALVSNSAFASTIDLSSPISGNGYPSFSYQDINGVGLTVSAYTNSCNGCSSIQSSVVKNFGSSGLGVEDEHAPNHAVDNEGQRFDFLFFEFDQAVSLDAIQVGWYQNDSDMSVFAYDGVDTGSVGDDLIGQSWDDLQANDWVFDGHYLDVAERANDTAQVNSDDLTSRFWLVGTQYWPLADGSRTFGQNVNSGVDYVKLRSIDISTPVQVSEPTSLALLGAGIFGTAVVRRRKKTQSKL